MDGRKTMKPRTQNKTTAQPEPPEPPVPQASNRWTVARRVVGLADFIERCPVVYHHKEPVKQYRLPGSAEAEHYAVLVRRAREFTFIHDHYQVWAIPGPVSLLETVDFDQLVEFLNARQGMVLREETEMRERNGKPLFIVYRVVRP